MHIQDEQRGADGGEVGDVGGQHRAEEPAAAVDGHVVHAGRQRQHARGGAAQDAGGARGGEEGHREALEEPRAGEEARREPGAEGQGNTQVCNYLFY